MLDVVVAGDVATRSVVEQHDVGELGDELCVAEAEDDAGLDDVGLDDVGLDDVGLDDVGLDDVGLDDFELGDAVPEHGAEPDVPDGEEPSFQQINK